MSVGLTSEEFNNSRTLVQWAPSVANACKTWIKRLTTILNVPNKKERQTLEAEFKHANSFLYFGEIQP